MAPKCNTHLYVQKMRLMLPFSFLLSIQEVVLVFNRFDCVANTCVCVINLKCILLFDFGV